jgi:hypothetical protein
MSPYVSSQSIIGELISNYGVSIANKEDDIISWIADAVQAIGFGTYTELKVEEMAVNDFRISIPQNLVHLITIVSGTQCARQVKDITKSLPTVITDELQKNLLQEIVAYYKGRQYVYSPEEIANASIHLDEEEERLNSMLDLYSNSKDLSIKTNLQYQMHFNYIKTNIETPTALLWYRAMLLDNEGFPAILDTFKFKEAIRLFVLKRLLMSGYQHPVLKWDTITMLSETAITAARNEKKQFTSKQQKAFVQNWTNPLFLTQY